jgi:hypothetical protein
MKLITTLLFTIFISVALSAQIVIDPDIIMFEATEEGVEVKIDVTNNTDEFTEIYWMFEPAENYPEEWGLTICDTRTCYVENTFISSINLPNLVDPSETILFKFTITSNGVEGTSFGILHLYSDSKFENEIAVSKPLITSVSDEVFENIVIYPNPASDYFQIKSDAQVKSLVVASITGQVLLSGNHTKGKMHSISHLPKGVFFVILRDENDDKIKTLRLIK